MLKAASIADLKAELQTLPQEELVAICLRLARFKRDNKELMGYLLFEAHQPDIYAEQVKQMMTDEFAAVNTANIWFAKKSIRKILRLANKYAKYAGSKELEVQLHIHFLNQLKQLPGHITSAPIMDKLARSEEQKIRKLIRGLHEDLQYDLLRQLEAT
jgi:hypothetical protein